MNLFRRKKKITSVIGRAGLGFARPLYYSPMGAQVEGHGGFNSFEQPTDGPLYLHASGQDEKNLSFLKLVETGNGLLDQAE